MGKRLGWSVCLAAVFNLGILSAEISVQPNETQLRAEVDRILYANWAQTFRVLMDLHEKVDREREEYRQIDRPFLKRLLVWSGVSSVMNFAPYAQLLASQTPEHQWSFLVLSAAALTSFVPGAIAASINSRKAEKLEEKIQVDIPGLEKALREVEEHWKDPRVFSNLNVEVLLLELKKDFAWFDQVRDEIRTRYENSLSSLEVPENTREDYDVACSRAASRAQIAHDYYYWLLKVTNIEFLIIERISTHLHQNAVNGDCRTFALSLLHRSFY